MVGMEYIGDIQCLDRLGLRLLAIEQVEKVRRLAEVLPHGRQRLVLTGAMTPLGFEGSDGLQNLTESLLAVRMLPPGVWLVIHNQVFPIERVRKDREKAQFLPI